jgi:hypothetical protein
LIGTHGGKPVGSPEKSDAAGVYDRIKRALMNGFRHNVLSLNLVESDSKRWHGRIEYLSNSIDLNKKDRAQRYHKSSFFIRQYSIPACPV